MFVLSVGFVLDLGLDCVMDPEDDFKIFFGVGLFVEDFDFEEDFGADFDEDFDVEFLDVRFAPPTLGVALCFELPFELDFLFAFVVGFFAPFFVRFVVPPGPCSPFSD